MRGGIEQIVAFPQGVDPAMLAEVQRYATLFWINNGPYNNLTARKFVLKTTAEALSAAVHQGGLDAVDRPDLAAANLEQVVDADLGQEMAVWRSRQIDASIAAATAYAIHRMLPGGCCRSRTPPWPRPQRRTSPSSRTSP